MIFTQPIHEFNSCHNPSGPDGGQFCAGSSTAVSAFREWFGKSQVVDEDGLPLRVFHGTTQVFDEFDPDRGNVEADFGAGIYFTNNPDDVAANYASAAGPDLDSKISQRAERIQQDYEDGNPTTVNALNAIFDDPANAFTAHDRETQSGVYAAALQLARDEMTEHGGLTIPVYLRMENPAIVGGEGETRLTLDTGEEDENGDYTSEPTGTMLEFVDTLRHVASRYDDGEVDNAIERIMENFEDLPLSKALTLLRTDEHFGYYTGDRGELVSNEIIRQTLEEMGFDGIIDRTVNDKFGTGSRNMTRMAGMDEDTVHYIVFDPEQIKSAIGNRGTFSARKRRFTEQAR